MRRPLLLLVLSVVWAGAARADLEAQAHPGPVFFDPVPQNVEGWTVQVEPAMLGPTQTKADRFALEMLENHLQRIRILLPEAALPRVQEVPIWIERQHPLRSRMCYHPSEAWLGANGHDPRMARAVHVPVAAALTSRQTMLQQPAVILHELAHAYHDRLPAAAKRQIRSAYRQARDSGTYEEVMNHLGDPARPYAMTNEREYFAESTEAFFYRNDFYPFVRGELRRHDPGMFKLLGELWNPDAPAEDNLAQPPPRRGP